jgi:hypothetical protein
VTGDTLGERVLDWFMRHVMPWVFLAFFAGLGVWGGRMLWLATRR